VLKARLRTTNSTVEEFLPDLLKYDGPAIDIIDPSRTYPIYGDASTSTDEAPGAGPLVLMVAWKGQLVEIGTIVIDERASLIDARSESSYGAHTRITTAFAPDRTTWGTSIDAYGTRPHSALAQDRLASTGGLVYFLSHADIEEGSVAVIVEEEDTLTRTRTAVAELREGVDYTIDYLSGRIWLLKPLAMMGPPRTIIRDSAAGGSLRWLVVTYRYRTLSPMDAAGHGEMVTQDVAGKATVGAFYRQEERDTLTERRGRTWVEVRPNTDTSIVVEAGRRWGDVQSFSESLDGGLSYRVTQAVGDEPANAFAAQAHTRIPLPRGALAVEAYGRHLDAEFGSMTYGAGSTLDAAGASVAWEPTTDVSLGWRGDLSQDGDVTVGDDRVMSRVPVGPFLLDNEARFRDTLAPAGRATRTDLGARLTYRRIGPSTASTSNRCREAPLARPVRWNVVPHWAPPMPSPTPGRPFSTSPKATMSAGAVSGAHTTAIAAAAI
jgi:hypothetical protein